MWTVENLIAESRALSEQMLQFAIMAHMYTHTHTHKHIGPTDAWASVCDGELRVKATPRVHHASGQAKKSKHTIMCGLVRVSNVVVGSVVGLVDDAASSEVHIEEVVLGNGDAAEQVISLAGPLLNMQTALPMILEKASTQNTTDLLITAAWIVVCCVILSSHPRKNARSCSWMAPVPASMGVRQQLGKWACFCCRVLHPTAADILLWCCV